MDHHCPFVRNCVGQHNLGYFVAFLAHATVGMVYCMALTFPPFRACWLPPSLGGGGACAAAGLEGSVLFVGPLFLFLVLGALLALQVLLLLADVRSVSCLLHLRRSWALGDLFRRLLRGQGLQSGSRASRYLMGPRRKWWHFVVPGAELARPKRKKA